MMPVLQPLLLLLFLLLAGNTASAEGRDDIAILGLGGMGTAVLKCLAAHQQQQSSSTNINIHAWNRGEAKRQAVQDLDITIHETPQDAINAADGTVLIFIDDWEGVSDLVTQNKWKKQQHAVLFSTYSPADVANLQEESSLSNNVTIVGGAIVGVPQTICTKQAYILISHDIPTLQPTGQVTVLPGNNAALPALLNMALIQVITFGIAGYELASLMVREFYATVKIRSDEEEQLVWKQFAKLASEIGPTYMSMLMPSVSKAISNSDYEKMYVPVGVFERVLEMHVDYMSADLGIHETFLTTYANALHDVADKSYGPAAWVENHVSDGLFEDDEDEEDPATAEL